MLKTRIAATILIRDGVAVQSHDFRRHLPVGRPEIAVEYLNRWGIDEIVLLDMLATREGRAPDPALVERCAARCQVPLAVGGGVRYASDFVDLLHAGADKVVVNTAAVVDPALVTAAAARFGTQCVLVSIDARPDGQGGYRVWTEGGRRETDLTAADWARRAQLLGAGEILLNAIHRDGGGAGFDVGLIRAVAEAVDIPVIAQGGAGHPLHFSEAARAGAGAVAAANYWHHTEHSVATTKHFLQQAGEPPVRLDTAFDYAGFGMGDNGRLAMADAAELERLRFVHIPADDS